MNDVGSTHTSPEGKNNCLTKLRDSFDTHMKYAEIIASFLFLSALTFYLIFLIFRKNFYQKFDIRKWQYKRPYLHNQTSNKRRSQNPLNKGAHRRQKIFPRSFLITLLY